MNEKLPLFLDKQNPPYGGMLSSSPWAPISVSPAPFQEQLGPSSGRPKSPGFTILLNDYYSMLPTIVNNPVCADGRLALDIDLNNCNINDPYEVFQ